MSNFFFCHYVFRKPSAAGASESVYMRERVNCGRDLQQGNTRSLMLPIDEVTVGFITKPCSRNNLSVQINYVNEMFNMVHQSEEINHFPRKYRSAADANKYKQKKRNVIFESISIGLNLNGDISH